MKVTALKGEISNVLGKVAWVSPYCPLLHSQKKPRVYFFSQGHIIFAHVNVIMLMLFMYCKLALIIILLDYRHHDKLQK